MLLKLQISGMSHKDFAVDVSYRAIINIDEDKNN